MKEMQTCLVMGGAGMLGYEIVRQLLSQGMSVRVLDIAELPEPPGNRRLEAMIGDIRNPQAVTAACEGVDTVFQTAAAVWDVHTPAKVYEEVNVEGNRNVLAVCRRLGVPRLVYTSSMDVVVDGRKPIVDGDESLPYPARMPRDPYSRSKIIAERMILEANDAGLSACSLRPVGMYGPRDKYHLGNIIAMARRGVSLRLGDGSARFSHVYSENVAHAHILAARALQAETGAAGQSYFICDHFPASNLFDFMEPFLRALDLPVPRRSIPYPLAYAMATVAEVVAPHSNFNRFAVIQTCVDHTFVHGKAERELGYHPIISLEDAFNRSVQWLKNGGGRPHAGQP